MPGLLPPPAGLQLLGLDPPHTHLTRGLLGETPAGRGRGYGDLRAVDVSAQLGSLDGVGGGVGVLRDDVRDGDGDLQQDVFGRRVSRAGD